MFVSDVAYFRNSRRDKPIPHDVGLGLGLIDDKGSPAPASVSLDDSPLAQFRQGFAKGRAANSKHLRERRFGGQAFTYFKQPEGDRLGNSVDNRIGPLDFRQGPIYLWLKGEIGRWSCRECVEK